MNRDEDKEKHPRPKSRVFSLCWHLPILPGRFQPSIVGTSELNCRVRDEQRLRAPPVADTASRGWRSGRNAASVERDNRISGTARVGCNPFPSAQKEKRPSNRMISSLCWHLPILPGRFQPSIVGTSELNCRVRDGNGCTLTVISTNYSGPFQSPEN